MDSVQGHTQRDQAEPFPGQQGDEEMQLPFSTDLPDAGVHPGHTGYTHSRNLGRKNDQKIAAQIIMPFIEDNRPAGRVHFAEGGVPHLFRRLMMAAYQCVTVAAGAIRTIRLGGREREGRL